MRFVRLGDTHLGVKQGSDVMLKFQLDYLESVFKYCEANDIGVIYQLGDFFDVRKYVYVNALMGVHDLMMRYPDIEVHWAPGNHDQTTKTDLSLSAGYALAKMTPNFIAHREFYTQTIDGKKITLVPWLCPENELKWQSLKNTGSDLVMGHFEISGFPFYQGVECEHGLSADDFKLFEQVASGHFHTRSKKGKIQYLGSPYHLTWADYKDGTNRGFDVFDTSTMTSTNVDNLESQSIFRTVDYHDGFSGDIESLRGKIVHIKVHDKKNAQHYGDFIKLIDSVAMNFKTSDLTLKEMMATATEELHTFDRLSQILEFVKAQDESIAEGLPEIITDLYNKANAEGSTIC